MKSWAVFSWLIWLLPAIPCKSQINQPLQAPRLLSPAEADTFLRNNGKEVSARLWEKVFGNTFPSQPVHVLLGNLDADSEQELALWFKTQETGTIVCFDRRQQAWARMGETSLNFFHGDNAPRIDSKTGMLLTYGYGWGSGYGSEILNLYQSINDSLHCVLVLLESEGKWLLGSTAHQFVNTRYRLISPEKIEATLVYRILAGDDMGIHSGRTIFSRKLVLEHHWNKDQKRFMPAQYPGLTGDDYLTDSEFELEELFAEEILKLKFHGPKWKRRALGNPEED